MTLDDILSRIPDIQAAYELVLNRGARCHPAYVHAYFESQVDFHVYTSERYKPQPEALRKALRISESLDIASTDHHWWLSNVPGIEFKIVNTTEEETIGAQLPPIKNDEVGTPYLVEPLPSGIILSTLSLLFAASFVFGNLSRYFPAYWGNVVNGVLDDEILPLITATLGVIDRRFPQLVLEEIEQTHIGDRVYRHSAIG